MCAWRTMLLRSSSHPDPATDTAHNLPTASNSSLNTLSSYTSTTTSSATTTTTTTTTAATSSALGLPAQPAPLPAVAAKQTTPTKKPVPFQNLGLHSGAASGNLGTVERWLSFFIVSCSSDPRNITLCSSCTCSIHTTKYTHTHTHTHIQKFAHSHHRGCGSFFSFFFFGIFHCTIIITT
ncbi:hypothetical protein EDD21DRAFT_393668 [Dissophora ornata]|nr:hypothetical protein EDD21DRAFT_393668 [Dissophora ornata]